MELELSDFLWYIKDFLGGPCKWSECYNGNYRELVVGRRNIGHIESGLRSVMGIQIASSLAHNVNKNGASVD